MPTYFETDKDPDSTMNWTIDWSRWLAADTIAGSTWIVPTGITEESDANTTTTATVYLSGGTAGEYYDVTNRITTAGGLITDRTIRVRVVER